MDALDRDLVVAEDEAAAGISRCGEQDDVDQSRTTTETTIDTDQPTRLDFNRIHTYRQRCTVTIRYGVD